MSSEFFENSGLIQIGILFKKAVSINKCIKTFKCLPSTPCSPSNTFFEEPNSSFCYYLATTATYSAKMARKSKFHHIWLIFRKKGSGTSEMCTMGSFRIFPHQITWKTNLWKVSQKSHLEYSHGLLMILENQKLGQIIKIMAHYHANKY
jgi:hypothetical protein